ncbi:MAG: DUF2306 domain-containing protein [Schleiferiaceae bacterium]|nr:DUF2306 domain-containing protein [Schleiferiaceae bacterium]
MELYLKITLITHIIAGFSALTTGLLALLAKKGGRLHRAVGKLFFFSMLLVALSALGISIPKQQSFLLMIAVFAFFQNYFGMRASQQRDMKPVWRDWAVLVIGSINSFFMVYSLDIVLVVFGIINGALAFGQLKIYLQVIKGEKLSKTKWLEQHIGMMVGAFIATLTAFIIVNVRDVSPSWLPWLAPTAVLVPLIIYYQRKYTGNTE